MSNGSEVMIYLSFLLSEFIATRRARLEAREAGFLVLSMIGSLFVLVREYATVDVVVHAQW